VAEAPPAVAVPALALFPLRTVLFPGGLLRLRVFEARYLDLVARCLRTGAGFGVVCLRQGSEVGRGTEPVHLEPIGVHACIDHVEGQQAGLLHLRCIGRQRFLFDGEPAASPDGLWSVAVRDLPPDAPCLPAPELFATVQALARAIAALRERGQMPFAEPLHLDDAGWVANRWCELLPIALAARQRLMELADPAQRLALVDEYLRQQRIIS